MTSIHDELYERLFTLQHLLRKNRMNNRMKNGPMGDPTHGQGRVLSLLKIQPGMSSRDLSYLLGIRQQSLNELLTKLEKNGYLTRTPSEEDKRVNLVHLTEKGENAEQRPPEDPSIFDSLTPEEQEALSGYLQKLIAALEKNLGDDWEEKHKEWMQDARERMGDEQFDFLMAMSRGGFRGPHSMGFRDGHMRHGRGPHGPQDRPHSRGPHGPQDHPHSHGPHGPQDHPHGREGCGRGRGYRGPIDAAPFPTWDAPEREPDAPEAE